MIAIDAVQRVIILVKKYWGYIFVPLFIFAAAIYVNSTHPWYRVTTKIALTGISPKSVVTHMQSPAMVRKAVNLLQLQASYYSENSPREELPADSLKARLEFTRTAASGGETWIKLIADSASVVGLNNVDTTAYYEFDKPVHESYGDFKILHGALHRNAPATYLVRVQDQSALIEQYHSKLRFDTDESDNSVTISILAGTPKKGVAFLNEMLYLYKNDKQATGRNASLSGPARQAGLIIVMQKPEHSVEEASVSPFWVYLGAATAGLLVPLGFVARRNRGKQPLSLKIFSLPGLVNRIQHRLALRQLD